ncbi:T9SS type A sorting domain-containing protein [Cognataquiflexum rubidum]|uniref:T9SS type A sorting domain-containing protein n=1 Tax=Cognataquiflexum rubidum TaxID=2922273 RepID=UPI001F146CC0|nr:T9SS type A sorting domain-containing protein [Cognataquiflexum rubidum]MCH6235253.1 T9SS type A sorting domain-containing protein [Cognataquiflexum rubidum]
MPIGSPAQTGPGGVGNATNNVLWLRADGSNYADGDQVSIWLDQSGNGNHVEQPNAAQQPIFYSGLMNGYPVIEFDNNFTAGQNDFLRNLNPFNLDGTPGLTIFTVTRRNALGDARVIISKRVNVDDNASYMVFFFNSNFLNVDIVNLDNRFTTGPTGFSNGANWLLSVRYDGTSPIGQRSRVYNGENLVITWTENATSIPTNNSPLVIGATHIGNNRPFGGNMAEIIQYRTAVNVAERIIVNNYLSAKYNIVLGINDVYVMDDPANGNYDHEVAGIGRFDVSNMHLDAQGTGLVRILNASNLGDNEFLMWGHDNGIAQATEFIDVPGIVEARFNRVWRVSERSTAGAAVDVGAIDLRVDLNGLGAIDVDDLVLLVDTDNDGAFQDETAISGAIDLGGDIYQFTGVTALADTRRFTFGTTDAAFTPLPVDLITWEGSCEDGKTVLKWVTAQEKENDFFTIERSLDAKNWVEVVKIDGAGNSEVQLEYEFKGLESIPGTTYFRLKQTDFDGTFAYSKIIRVTCQEESKFSLTVYPNPSNGIFKINLSQAGAEISIFDSTGKPVFHQQVQTQETFIDISDFPSGIYFLQAWNGREVVGKKVVVER